MRDMTRFEVWQTSQETKPCEMSRTDCHHDDPMAHVECVDRFHRRMWDEGNFSTLLPCNDPDVRVVDDR